MSKTNCCTDQHGSFLIEQGNRNANISFLEDVESKVCVLRDSVTEASSLSREAKLVQEWLGWQR